MYYVYIIRSISKKVLYFGQTCDLDKRLSEHNSNLNFSTKNKGPWEYVYIEGYKVKKDALIREKKLKNYGNARTYVKKRIANSLA